MVNNVNAKEILTSGQALPRGERFIRLFFYLIIFFFTSCLFDSYSDKIDEDFEVGWVDDPKDRNIYFRSQGILYR